MMAKKKKQKHGAGLQKANPLGLPGIGPTTVINGKGEKLKRTDPTSKEDRDPRAANFNARCRSMGVKASEHNRVAINVPYLGTDLGKVLHHEKVPHPEIMRIWSYWQSFCLSQHIYRARILAISIHPRISTHAMVSERLEASSEDEPDVRTAEERDEDARRGHDRWLKILDKGMDPRLRVALYAAERGDGPDLWRDGKPTQAGYAAARAVQHLADLAER